MATRPKTNITDKAIQKVTHQTASAANHNNVAKPAAMAVESITTEPTATNDPAASGKVSRKEEMKFHHEVRRTNAEERLESVAKAHESDKSVNENRKSTSNNCENITKKLRHYAQKTRCNSGAG